MTRPDFSWRLYERWGTFVVRMRIRYPGTVRGVRKWRTTGTKNHSEALREAQRIVAEEEATFYGRKPSCTLAELGQEWLNLNSNSVSEAHYSTMERHLRLYFDPLLDLDLKEITTDRVKAALNAYRANHNENSAVTWRRYLRRLFGWAVESERIQFIPWKQKALGKMKAKGRPRPILLPTHWRPWLEAVDAAAGGPNDSRALMLRMMLACGLREMEVVRARWEGLRLDLGTYTPVLPTKGGDVTPRAVPDWMMDLLRPRACPSGWMFPNPKTGHPYSRGCCRRIVLQANQAAGTPGIMHHRLRATVATLLLARVSPLDAQIHLEHKDPRTTLIYNVEDPTAVRAALNEMGSQAGMGGNQGPGPFGGGVLHDDPLGD